MTLRGPCYPPRVPHGWAWCCDDVTLVSPLTRVACLSWPRCAGGATRCRRYCAQRPLSRGEKRGKNSFAVGERLGFAFVWLQRARVHPCQAETTWKCFEDQLQGFARIYRVMYARAGHVVVGLGNVAGGRACRMPH